jgi:hypothetical protein
MLVCTGVHAMVLRPLEVRVRCVDAHLGSDAERRGGE